jgi:hypothetical protein
MLTYIPFLPSRVGDIVHTADPAAAKTLYGGLDYKYKPDTSSPQD